MLEVRNLNGKRVCDISDDSKSIEIVQKDCLTRITANPDGTLNVENIHVAELNNKESARTQDGSAHPHPTTGIAGSACRLFLFLTDFSALADFRNLKTKGAKYE